MKHFRHRVTIHEAIETRNEFGEMEQAWAAIETVPTVWAMVTQTGEAESVKQGELKTIGKYQVEMWYRSDLTTEHRLIYGDKTLEIESVINEGELSRKLIVICSETE